MGMRLIDANALMTDLEKWQKQIDPSEDKAIPPMEDIIVSTLMTIEEQPTIEPYKWIPIKEALPEGDGYYLVTGKKQSVYISSYKNEWWYGGAKPLAWMPLPEPYK